jgi:small subunit ribosomal protein S3
MGQKINPTSFRTGIIKDYASRWLPKKFKFEQSLREDFIIRTVVQKRIGVAGIDSVVIEKAANNVRVKIRAAKPGLIIGRGGKGIEDLTRELEQKLNAERVRAGRKEAVVLQVTIEEIKRNEVSSAIVAQQIAADLERRMPFRRTVKKYLERVAQSREVKGVKIRVSGRLDGSEIARTEQLGFGSLPLQTLRADIDYAQGTAFTTYGTVGIKVWVYKGEKFMDR